MTEKPRRPILHLKFAPADPPAPPPAPAARAPEPAKALTWKCKPCGKAFQTPAELADDESVRCAACNARLGLAADFRADPPNLDRVRARLAAEPAPRPATRPRPFARASGRRDR
jgi:DNA-directed RNA polymerase subunit RPC12/RpoP